MCHWISGRQIYFIQYCNRNLIRIPQFSRKVQRDEKWQTVLDSDRVIWFFDDDVRHFILHSCRNSYLRGFVSFTSLQFLVAFQSDSRCRTSRDSLLPCLRIRTRTYLDISWLIDDVSYCVTASVTWINMEKRSIKCIFSDQFHKSTSFVERMTRVERNVTVVSIRSLNDFRFVKVVFTALDWRFCVSATLIRRMMQNITELWRYIMKERARLDTQD